MHEELQRTISIENKHTSYCFKNCGLLHLSTQTFPKKIIVNHLINGENRRKSKRLPAQRGKNQSAICNDVIRQNWSCGPCPTPPTCQLSVGLYFSLSFFTFSFLLLAFFTINRTHHKNKRGAKRRGKETQSSSLHSISGFQVNI